MSDEKQGQQPPAYNPAPDPAYPNPPPQYSEATGFPSQPEQGYPPQQQGYPPQQQGYPPQQPGYPPQQVGYPPQQPGYPPQQPYPTGQIPPPGATVNQQPLLTTTVVTTTNLHYADRPTNTTCPNCHNQVTTQVSRSIGGMVWLIAAILCIVGLWPCCLIPFCITDMYDCEHYCPVCKYHLGAYRRL